MENISQLSSANKTYIEKLKNNSNNQQVSNINLETKSDSVELSTKKHQQFKRSMKYLAIGTVAALIIAFLGGLFSIGK